MKSGYLFAAAIAVVFSTSAWAADADKDAVKEKKICRTETVTGSLIAKRRVCLTKTEWDKVAAETKRNLDDLQRNSNAIPHTAGGVVSAGAQ